MTNCVGIVTHQGLIMESEELDHYRRFNENDAELQARSEQSLRRAVEDLPNINSMRVSRVWHSA